MYYGVIYVRSAPLMIVISLARYVCVHRVVVVDTDTRS